MGRIASEEISCCRPRPALITIGALLIVESVGSLVSTGPPLGTGTLALVATGAGVAIGAVSTLLGVAGGELIIPTLELAFGVPIKAAGTMSLLISIAAMLVGLARHRSRGAFQNVRAAGRVVVPMAEGAWWEVLSAGYSSSTRSQARSSCS